MVADRGKKSKVSDRTEVEDSDHIDTELVLSIEKLQEVQDQLEKVNEEASEKVLAVEQKYNKIRRPIYVKRNEIIKSIPDFWLTAFLSHPALGDLLSEEDSKIFKYLDSLDVEDFKDLKLGYSITFGAANGVNHEKKGNKRPPFDESFFSWFSETQPKDTVEGLHDEVAEIIKEDLWPNPLKYFNNEADEDDSDGDEEDEEKGDDDEEDDDDEGSDEEQEDS
ncbi:NAP1-related protein 2 [Camellia lanceoleosa]|uniref:NAP1-related protein 2 n=1 Tax=Camellia lanceoleosa TaxID=1840588 RepID=A0ACC0I249_9ERIC|nr:NAP1-related protein 2 [Camellia lanceoleosa]